MSDYYNIKYNQIFVPTSPVDLGTQTNSFSNVFVENNLTVGDTTVDGQTLNVPRIGNISYVGDNTAADIAGGETISITGSGFKAGATVVIDGTTVSIVTVVSNSLITFLSPAKAAGSYTLYVVNADGGTAISLVGIQYSGVPLWNTSAGSLGSLYETQSFSSSVNATGADIPITYSVSSGSLPTGMTLNSGNGLISGTAGIVNGSTTYNFTVAASDYQNQDVGRNFSITINPDVISWNSPANLTEITQFETLGVTQTLNATSFLGKGITYTANTLPSNLTISGNSITGNLTAGAANTVSLITATSSETNKTATRTLRFTVNADIVTWSSPANNTTISQYEFSSVSQALNASSLLGYSVSYSANSLPTGITISGSNITGTLPSTATTANSTSLITATSSTTNRTATRNINFSIQPDVVTWSSPANGSTYNVNTNDSASIALSASSAAGRSISYSATGLPSGLSISGSNITGTYTGSGSSAATITATAATTGKTATRTLNFNVTAPFNISYLTQTNGYLRDDQSPSYTISHPGGVQAGDLMILFHCGYTNGGARWIQTAPAGFTFVSYRFDDGDFSDYSSNTSSYRVLPNTNAFTLPGTRTYQGTSESNPNFTTYQALYFRPNRPISSVSIGSINEGLGNWQSGISYPSGSGQAFPEVTNGTSTVSPSGQTAPVIVVGANYYKSGAPYSISISSSPGFDGTVASTQQSGGSIITGYKVYGSGTSPANHTLTYGPSGGYNKIMNSFWLKVS